MGIDVVGVLMLDATNPRGQKRQSAKLILGVTVRAM
jgi:hypothetical protein